MTHTRHKNHTYILSILTCGTLFFVCHQLHAAEFVPLTGIPGAENPTTGELNLVGYLNALYMLTISLGALYGVIKIAIAGVKWSMSDVVTSKEDAKKDIRGALLGLAILLSTFIALNTINPELTNLNILRGINPVDVPTSVISVRFAEICTWGTHGASDYTTKDGCIDWCTDTYGGEYDSVNAGNFVTGTCSYSKDVIVLLPTYTYICQAPGADSRCQQECVDSGGTYTNKPEFEWSWSGISDILGLGYCEFTPIAVLGSVEPLPDGTKQVTCTVDLLSGYNFKDVELGVSSLCPNKCSGLDGTFYTDTDGISGYCIY